MSNFFSALLFLLAGITFNLHMYHNQDANGLDFTVMLLMLSYACHAGNNHAESK